MHDVHDTSCNPCTNKIRKLHGKMICTLMDSIGFAHIFQRDIFVYLIRASEENLGPVASDGLALHPDLVVFLQCHGGVALRCGAASISHLVLRAMVRICVGDVQVGKTQAGFPGGIYPLVI